MKHNLIIAAQQSINQQGNLNACHQIIEMAQALSLRCEFLNIDPLSTDWHSPLSKGHFRSGCGPIEALAAANRMLRDEHADLVIIQGRDYIASEYSKEQRRQQMAIYGDISIPEAYDRLAERFYQKQGWQEADFIELRDAIFANLSKTAGELQLPKPDTRWYEPLTTLYRGVDCANPLVDFNGCMIMTHPDVQPLLTPMFSPISVKAIGLGIIDMDGPEHLAALAEYDALQQAVAILENELKFSLPYIVSRATTRMEVYTCFPVVPLAFLILSGIAPDIPQLRSWLAIKALSQTGGMNLGRGAWNNPALHGLITMCHRLQNDPSGTYGIVHGNGGLGYKQGVAALVKW